MKYRDISLSVIAACSLMASADTIPIKTFRHAGPFPLTTPLMLDSLNNQKKGFETVQLLETPISLEMLRQKGEIWNDSILKPSVTPSLQLLGFTLDNGHYTKGELKIEGIKNYKVYLDGKKIVPGELKLTPATREIIIKCLTDTTTSDTVRVSVITDSAEPIVINPSLEKGRRYTIKDIFTGPFIRNVDVSPSGKYLYTGYYYTNEDGTASYEYRVNDMANGRQLYSSPTYMEWMPKSDKLTFIRTRDGKKQLVAIDPSTLKEEILATDLPESNYVISPDETFLILNKNEEGAKEKQEGLYQIRNPEDRQKGWRDRNQLIKYDLSTGISLPLTYGNKSASLCGITADGKKLLVMTSDQRLTSRPTTLMSVHLLDLDTMESEKLIDGDGFISSATISPDGKTLVLTGSPETLGGVGNVLPEGKVPSMVDNQMYLMDVESKQVTPLTRNFNPSVGSVTWNPADNLIYFSAEDRDRKQLFRANPSTGKIESLGLPEDYVMNFALSTDAPVGAYYGESADSSYKLYTFNTKTLKPILRDDLNPVRTAGINIGKTYDWSYVTSRGDTIQARYNLPDDFDPAKKYPMVVYYYGGCSPTPRLLDTTYNPHLFSANGFIFLVINPSGATGFGQEFASRHVATAGEGVAQDIIEGVKQFTRDNEFVNADKIGCVGASYGGFMTQYLQTVTDIFAAAISHAGISDHTSYWGEGYWGYSYSEVSMAGKYPWADKELYVDHSPLYNADKIHTPLLFLHGDADTNVPVGESIQMFTALKLLGRETAFVAVKDTNHWVQDFTKREHWLNTMLAWFTKYLQDNPQWWNDMYEE